MPVSTPGDTFGIELDRDEIVVRVDKGEDEMTIEAACVEISTAGYYRIFAGVEYSGGKSNESFFLQVAYPDSSSAGLCDPNAGEFRVVNIVGDLPKAEFDTTRDAGVFYFREGINRIILNHYALIADEYPEFINPDSDGFDGPESVHLFELVLHFVNKRTFDLEIIHTANSDSAAVDHPFSLTLKVTNHGPGTARDMTITDEVSERLEFDATAFTLPPDSIVASEQSQIIFWHVDSLAVAQMLTIELTGKAAQMQAEDSLPRQIHSIGMVASACDTTDANNIDNATVVLFAPPPMTDVGVSERIRTDSLVVQGQDSIWFARAGETFSYFLTITNSSQVAAENVTVQDALPDSVQATDGMAGDTLNWTLGTLPPLADTTLRIAVTVAPQMPTGTNLLINTVSVESDNDDPEKLQNNSAADTVFNFVKLRIVDLSVSQSARTDSFALSGEDTVWFAKPGGTISYALFVHNLGNRAASQVMIQDSLPTFVSAVTNPVSATIDWRLPKLPAFADTILTFDAVVADDVPVGLHPLVNIVGVQARNETPGLLENNLAVDTTFALRRPPVTRLTDLSISQSVKTDSFEVRDADTLWYAIAGESITYRVTVRNEEALEAQQVVVQDVLPDSVQVGGLAGGDTLVWRLGNLAPLADTTFAFVAVVSRHITQPNLALVNRALVHADNEDSTKLSNNVSVQLESVFAIPAPDMTHVPDSQFREGCGFFTLDFNVYRPGRGVPLGIDFELQQPQSVRLDVYDLSGYHVKTLVERTFDRGRNRFLWDGLSANGQETGSGVYLIVLRSDNLQCWKKVILAR